MDSKERIGSIDLEGQIDACRRKLDLLKDSVSLKGKKLFC